MTRKLAPLTEVRSDFENLVEADRAAGRMTPMLEQQAEFVRLAVAAVTRKGSQGYEAELASVQRHVEKYAQMREQQS